MANILKKAAAGLLEKMFDSARVTAVRAWEPATLYEVDVHLPFADMEKWDTVRRVKCKVGLLEYRDYTPAVWDAGTRVCTLYIEAGHEGTGSRWVKQLKPGDEILLGAVHAAQLPARPGRVLCLGDGSALGHFMALRQLADREKFPLETAILLHDGYRIPEPLLRNHPEIDWLADPGNHGWEALETWCLAKDLQAYTSVYIAGYIPMVTGLRKKLKTVPGMQARVFAHGFWS